MFQTHPNRKSYAVLSLMLAALIVLQACAATPTVPPATETPAPPSATPVPVYQDAKAPVADRVADLLSRMTLDEKVGQMTQIDRGFLLSKDDIAKYYLGSLLSGGGSVPKSNTPQGWEDMYDDFQSVALSTRLGIPLIYGIDAVHGHNNVYGATIFPHNIGLGATRDPELVQKIGRATAQEVAGTGIDWTFSPCICVARDERWGRTYESFGEDPALVQTMTTVIDGYQGSDLSAGDSILATAKHFAGDGGTTGGKDQGNTEATEEDFRALFVTPYESAVKRNVGSIMVSFSSWNGEKMHGNQHLITEVLKGELGFKGFVVSDWAAVKQLKGDYPAQVSAAINAGIDMVMVPDDYQTFTLVLKTEVNNGHIPMSRIDDAVSRILTKKFELALFEKPYADRSYATQIGSAEHRDLARQAVRESLVLLKNDNNILPLSKNLKKIFVAGKNADDIGSQSGGWTLTWQGSTGKITPGMTILDGITEAVSADTLVRYDRSASTIDASFEAAIVVIGETPYAEFKGDARSLALDAIDLNALKNVKASGVPTVVVLVSGRPMIVTEQLPDWEAFVAAWLPGTEGQGVADVLFGDYNPTGKLPHSWPRSMDQIPINVGDSDYDPLFPFGFGLSYQ